MDAERAIIRRFPKLAELDARAVDAFARAGAVALRVALGLVFVWFGALKVAGASPVFDLVTATLAPLPGAWSVPALGVAEILLGVGLVTLVFPRATLALFALQMIGTFALFLVHPEVAFEGGNPLRLTVTGEFVVKNVVLLAAGLAVAGTVRPARSGRARATCAGANSGADDAGRRAPRESR